jgi:hypothetical protein
VSHSADYSSFFIQEKLEVSLVVDRIVKVELFLRLLIHLQNITDYFFLLFILEQSWIRES